jgi:membrane protein
MGTSWLFSLYVDRFGRYSRIYGGLGGVIILMIWIFISSITLLMGNEVNNLLFHHGETVSDAKKM